MEHLAFPTKSPLDDNLYKTVKLRNGLRALLITEHEIGSGDKDDAEDQDENCVPLAVSTFNKRILQFNKTCPSNCDVEPNRIVKKKWTSKAKSTSKSKFRKRCPFTHTKMAIVALNVGAGSFNDPLEAPGLAHLCEHMLFLGSEEYPGRADFDLFLTQNGGESNATTEGFYTIFMFTIANEKLEEALRMLMHFILAPLMKLEDITIERDLVDAEFKDMRKNDDYCRRLRLLQTTGKMNHSVTKFGHGTKESLTPEGRTDEELQTLVKEFKEKYYGSDHMSIVIQSGYHTGKLLGMVNTVCGQLRPGTIPRPKLADEGFPFSAKDFCKLYKVVPIRDITKMYITWALAPLGSQSYLSKPLEYIARVIANEGCGGLAFCLRQRRWITEINAEPGRDTFESNDWFQLFTIELNMTEEGLENYEQVLKITFAFLKFARSKEPCAWLFEEFQNISAMAFHLDDNELSESVRALSVNMKKCDPEDVLLADTLVMNWDADAIQSLWKKLTPRTANYMLVSKSFQNVCNQTEHYFQIDFRAEDVPEPFLRSLRRSRISRKLQLESPCLNPFTAANFCKLKETEENLKKDDIPVCVFSHNKMEFWNYFEWGKDSIAEVCYSFALCSSFHHRSPQATALLDIWLQIVKSNIVPQIQCGNEARLFVTLERTPQGIILQFCGLSHKMPLFIDQVFGRIFRICKETNGPMFELNKTIQLQTYYENLTTPETMVLLLKDYVNYNCTWLPSELANALKPLTFEKFKKFCYKFSQSLYIIGFAEGNATQDGTEEMARDLLKRFKLDSDNRPPLPDVQIHRLPIGDTIFRVRSLLPDDNSGAVMNVYQIGTGFTNSCMALMLTDLMYEPAFQYLRNRENLAYVVDVDCELTFCMIEITISLLTRSETHSASHIKSKIDEFVEWFYYQNIKYMSQTQFNMLKSERGWTQDGFFPQNDWNQILCSDLEFDKNDQLMDIALDLEVPEFKKFFRKYLFQDASTKVLQEIRKMSLQVVGCADQEYNIETVQVSENKRNIPQEFTRMLDKPKKSNKKSKKKIDSEEEEDDDCTIIGLRPLQPKPGEHVVEDFYNFKKTLMRYPRQP